MTTYLLTNAQRDLIASATVQPVMIFYDVDINLCKYIITDDLIDPFTLIYDVILTDVELTSLEDGFKIQRLS